MALATLRLPPTTDQDAAYSIGANYGVGVLDRGLTFGDHEADSGSIWATSSLRPVINGEDTLNTWEPLPSALTARIRRQMKYYRRWRKGSHVPGSILFRRVKADYLGRCHISCGNPLAVAPVVGTRDSILFYPSGREFHGFERCTVNWNEEVPTAGVAVDVVGQSIRQIEASYGEGAGAQSLLGVRTDWDCHIYAREGADVHGRVESLRFGCPVAHVALSPWFAEAAVVAANGAVCLWSASCAQASETHLMSTKNIMDTAWRCVAFGPHPRILISASSGSVELLDFRVRNATRTTTVQLAEDISGDHEPGTRLTALTHHRAKEFEIVTACTNFISVMDIRMPLRPVLRWSHDCPADPPAQLALVPFDTSVVLALHKRQMEVIAYRYASHSYTRAGAFPTPSFLHGVDSATVGPALAHGYGRQVMGFEELRGAGGALCVAEAESQRGLYMDGMAVLDYREEGGPFGLACLINNGGVYTAKYEHRPRQLCTPPPTPDLNEDNDICYGFHTLPMRYSIFNHAAAWQELSSTSAAETNSAVPTRDELLAQFKKGHKQRQAKPRDAWHGTQQPKKPKVEQQPHSALVLSTASRTRRSGANTPHTRRRQTGGF